MATLGSLIISLEANTAKFESAMSKAEYTAKKSSDAIKSSMLSIGGALVAAFSISKIESFIASVASMESGLLKMAGRLNTNVETLSSFGVMARKTGMDTESFYLALTRLEKGMSAAALKSEEVTGKLDEEGEEIQKNIKTYDELGLKADVLRKMPMQNYLMELAQAFKDNIDPADRVRIAMELFGKSGAGMVNILKGGAADIQKWITEQENLGIITTENAKKAAEFTNATKNLTASWDAFKRELAEGVIPGLGAFIARIVDAIKAVNEFNQRKATLGEHFGAEAASKFGTLGQTKAGQGPYGEAAESYYPTAPYVPDKDVRKPPARPGDTVKAGGGKSGGGGGDMGLDRMQSIIDRLYGDLAKLNEGLLAGITAWSTKEINEINKVGQKGADTERALSLVAQMEAAKKKKATEDYELFVAEKSGDTYKQIEAQGKADLEKYKGFAGVKAVTDATMARKKFEEDRKNDVARDNMQKNYLEGLSSITLDLKQQYELKKKMLALDIKMSHADLEDSIKSKGKGLKPGQADEMRSLLAMTNQTKKFKMEWEQVQAETQQYSQLLSTIGSSFSSVVTGIANGTMTAAQGIQTLLQSIQDAILTMIMNMVMKWAEGQVMILGLNAAASMGLITQEAAVAGAKAYSAYAAIPFVGLALGAAAAAAVMGIMMALGGSMKSSAGGLYDVQGGTLAALHPEETVLPAWAAKSWRDIVERGEMPGGGPGENGKTGGGSTVVYNPTIHINAIDARGVEAVLAKHGKVMVKTLNRELRRHGKGLLGPSHG